jgi:hypothetical protein
VILDSRKGITGVKRQPEGCSAREAPLPVAELVEMTEKPDGAACHNDEHHRPQRCAQDKGTYGDDSHQPREDKVIAIIDVKAGHEAILATKTKSIKGPVAIPRRKP